MFRFIYKYGYTNLKDVAFSQEQYSFEEITQIDLSKIKINRNLNSNIDSDDVCVFPIDFQGIHFDSIIENIKEICLEAERLCKENKTIILLYTSTEPFFFGQADDILFDLVKRFDTLNFALSGIGYTGINDDSQKLLDLPNVSFITKLWYFDRVHLEKTYIDKSGPHHFIREDQEAPKDFPKDLLQPNKFLLIMRNPRLHRLIMSSFIENDKLLNSTRYSRNWSLNAYHIQDILKNKNISNDEAIYQTHLILDNINQLRGILDDRRFRTMLDTAFEPAITLDMPDIGYRGFPESWLFNDISINIVAGGEGEGYGCADEKQMIPMYYKKPFINFGCKGVNEELEKIGFHVFRDCWDLSWSNANFLWDRVNGCFQLLKKLSTLSEHDMEQLILKATPQIERNYKHIKTGNFRIQSNENFMRSLAEC